MRHLTQPFAVTGPEVPLKSLSEIFGAHVEKELETGFVVHVGCAEEYVIARASVCFVDTDGARGSSLCQHLGARCGFPCRRCKVCLDVRRFPVSW